VGCSNGSDPAPEPEPIFEPEPDFGFPSTDLWGEDISYQSFQASDKTKIDSLAKGPNGEICYVLREASVEDLTAELSSWDSRVQCIDALHSNILNHQRTGKGILKDVTFSDDGNIIIAELIDAPSENTSTRFFLKLSVYSNSGTLLEESILEDPASQEERYYYSVSDGEVTREELPDIVIDDKPVFVSSAKVSLKWHNNALYLLAYSYGLKLYKFDIGLQSEWDVQVMPAYTWLWTTSLQNDAAFTINDMGEIFVAFELFAEDADIYEMHFSRNLNKNNDLGDNAVSVYTTEGQYQRTILLGKDEYTEKLTGIVYHDNKLWLGASVRHEKPDATSSTTEWDLLLMSAWPDDGSIVDYHLIDYDKEDIATDFNVLPNGNFLFAGTSGYIQVDTNSQVSEGNGVILELSQEGEILRKSIMSQPRNVVTQSILPMNNNEILFTNIFDGPITHTCDNDNSLCYNKASFGIATLRD